MEAPHARPFRPWTGYGLVLLLIVASFVWAAASDSRYDRAGRVVLGAATFLLALRAAGVRRQVIAIVSIPVGVAVAGAIVAFGRSDHVSQGSGLLISALLIGGTSAAVFIDIRRSPQITPHLIGGLLCVYLVIGMFFTFVYRTVEHFGEDPFFAQKAHATSTDFLYFSFVTLTTVGYGDLTAATDLGRTLAIVEALTGQLYLVTVVALGVANLVRAPRERASTPRP
jgi:voltage-gated potassium channel Kch